MINSDLHMQKLSCLAVSVGYVSGLKYNTRCNFVKPHIQTSYICVSTSLHLLNKIKEYYFYDFVYIQVYISHQFKSSVVMIDK